MVSGMADVNVGDKINFFTIIEKLGPRSVKVKCDCGKEMEKGFFELFPPHGKSRRSCGCKKGKFFSEEMVRYRESIIGTEIGNFIILGEYSLKNKYGKKTGRTPYVKVLCKVCNKAKEMDFYRVINRVQKTCGCSQSKERFDEIRTEMIGTEYYSLTIIDLVQERGFWWIIANCSCGTKGKYIKYQNFLRGEIKGCGCKRTLGYSKYFPGWYLREQQRQAKKRKKEFKLTLEILDKIYEKQNGECFYTKIKLVIPQKRGDKCNVSIDRIDSNFGYTEDNIRLSTIRANYAKGPDTTRQFIEMCHLIAKNHPI